MPVSMHHPAAEVNRFRQRIQSSKKNEAIRYRYISNDCNMDEEQCEVQKKNSGIGIFTNAAVVFLERFKCGNNYIFCSIVAETGSA